MAEGEQLYRTVQCPKCFALEGEHCTTRRGSSHAARRLYAQSGKEPFELWFRRQMLAIIRKRSEQSREDESYPCNNGPCPNRATWKAEGHGILLLACDGCMNQDNAAAFGLAFERIELSRTKP